MVVVELVERAHRRAEPHAVAELCGHGLREPLVAAGDPVAGQRLERRHVLEDLGGEPVGAEGGGDLDAREDGLRGRGGEAGGGDDLRHGGGGAGRRGGSAAGRQRFGGRPRHRSARLLQLLRGQLHPARLAHVVAHAGVGQLEPEPLRERAHHLVAREHELGAALDHRASHAVRPHAAADPVAGLEDAHVDAAVGELERRREARVARPDDRDPAQNSRQWGSDFAMSTQTTQ